MKKGFALLAGFLTLLLVSTAWGAGAVTYSWYYPHGSKSVAVLHIAWTADAADGSVPDTTITTGNIPGHVMFGETDPGATAPTDNYDLEIEDALGADIFGGQLGDRDSSATEVAEPLVSYRFIDGGTLTFKLTNNSVNSATGTLDVYVLERR